MIVDYIAKQIKNGDSYTGFINGYKIQIFSPIRSKNILGQNNRLIILRIYILTEGEYKLQNEYKKYSLKSLVKILRKEFLEINITKMTYARAT